MNSATDLVVQQVHRQAIAAPVSEIAGTLQLLLNYDAMQTVKAWLIGLNPQLGDVSPAEALREGRLKETLSAAHAFTVGG